MDERARLVEETLEGWPSMSELCGKFEVSPRTAVHPDANPATGASRRSRFRIRSAWRAESGNRRLTRKPRSGFVPHSDPKTERPLPTRTHCRFRSAQR